MLISDIYSFNHKLESVREHRLDKNEQLLGFIRYKIILYVQNSVLSIGSCLCNFPMTSMASKSGFWQFHLFSLKKVYSKDHRYISLLLLWCLNIWDHFTNNSDLLETNSKTNATWICALVTTEVPSAVLNITPQILEYIQKNYSKLTSWWKLDSEFSISQSVLRLTFS